MLSRSLLLFLAPLAAVVDGSSLVTYQQGSAYCTGNLEELEFVSAQCLDEENGCTWGSTVSLFMQGKWNERSLSSGTEKGLVF